MAGVGFCDALAASSMLLEIVKPDQKDPAAKIRAMIEAVLDDMVVTGTVLDVDSALKFNARLQAGRR